MYHVIKCYKYLPRDCCRLFHSLLLVFWSSCIETVTPECPNGFLGSKFRPTMHCTLVTAVWWVSSFTVRERLTLVYNALYCGANFQSQKAIWAFRCYELETVEESKTVKPRTSALWTFFNHFLFRMRRRHFWDQNETIICFHRFLVYYI